MPRTPQTDANQNTEQVQRQERLKNAIEHLGHDSDSVRLGGAYELFHLAKDTPDLRQTCVMDILGVRSYPPNSGAEKEYRQVPSHTVQQLALFLAKGQNIGKSTLRKPSEDAFKAY